MAKRRVVLIDGKNLCFVQHHTHRFLSSRGRPTSVLYAVLSSLLTLSKRYKGAPLVFVWDGLGKTWRHELGKQSYKANRQGPKNPEVAKVLDQLPILYQVLDRLGVRQYVIQNLECDDLIGILAKQMYLNDWFDEIIIHSSDKDFYQLISAEVKVPRRDKKDNKVRFVDDQYLLGKFGVAQKDWLTYRALTGDPSDNIPNAKKGLGPVAAKKLLALGLGAGVKATAEHFTQLSRTDQKKFKELKTAWSQLHLNFLLSAIVQTPEHPMLSNSIKLTLRALLQKLKRRSFYRDPEKQTEENFQWLTEFLIDHEMPRLLSLRRELWNLT